MHFVFMQAAPTQAPFPAVAQHADARGPAPQVFPAGALACARAASTERVVPVSTPDTHEACMHAPAGLRSDHESIHKVADEAGNALAGDTAAVVPHAPTARQVTPEAATDSGAISPTSGAVYDGGLADDRSQHCDAATYARSPAQPEAHPDVAPQRSSAAGRVFGSSAEVHASEASHLVKESSASLQSLGGALVQPQAPCQASAKRKRAASVPASATVARRSSAVTDKARAGLARVSASGFEKPSKRVHAARDTRSSAARRASSAHSLTAAERTFWAVEPPVSSLLPAFVPVPVQAGAAVQRQVLMSELQTLDASLAGDVRGQSASWPPRLADVPDCARACLNAVPSATKSQDAVAAGVDPDGPAPESGFRAASGAAQVGLLLFMLLVWQSLRGPAILSARWGAMCVTPDIKCGEFVLKAVSCRRKRLWQHVQVVLRLANGVPRRRSCSRTPRYPQVEQRGQQRRTGRRRPFASSRTAPGTCV